MNRFLRAVLLTVAALLLLYLGSFAVYYHAIGVAVLRTKMLWAVAGLIGFLAVAAWRFPLRARFMIFLLLLTMLVLELALQAAGWLGVLPGVNTKLKAPYARVYWSAEGRGNSVRNREGWNYPAFDLQAPFRIAYIGDSQVEAVEVHRTRNQAALLNGLLRSQGPGRAVLGLGCHGTGPAYSLEVIEYAHRHFQPQEAIVLVSLGSDITEASPALNSAAPDRFIYYQAGPGGALQVHPASVGAREHFRQSLEWSHRSVFFNLPVILNSHCMTLQLATSLRDTFLTRRRQREIAARAAPAGDREGAEFQRLGFNPAPFAVTPDAEARAAMAVLIGQLRRAQEICQAHGMKLRLVLLPAFPKVFYDSQKGRDWRTEIGKYDYLKPERELAAFARSHAIPVLPLGEYIRAKNLEVEEIRSLYLSGGVGHLTEKGHRFCAEAVFETFYR